MYNIHVPGISCLDILNKQNKCTNDNHQIIQTKFFLEWTCTDITAWDNALHLFIHTEHQWRPIKSQLLQFILTEPNYIYRPHKWKKQIQYFSNLG